MDQLVLLLGDVDESKSYTDFLVAARSLFEDRITWYRIVALFAFGGRIAVECVKNERPEAVINVADWIAVFCYSRLEHWICQNGGVLALCDIKEPVDNDFFITALIVSCFLLFAFFI